MTKLKLISKYATLISLKSHEFKNSFMIAHNLICSQMKERKKTINFNFIP